MRPALSEMPTVTEDAVLYPYPLVARCKHALRRCACASRLAMCHQAMCHQALTLGGAALDDPYA